MAQALPPLPTPLPHFRRPFPQGPGPEPIGPLGAGEIAGDGPVCLDRLLAWDPQGLRLGGVPSQGCPGGLSWREKPEQAGRIAHLTGLPSCGELGP